MLPDGKFIISNNDKYVYVGYNDIELIKLAMYTDIVNIKQPIIGRYNGDSSSLGSEPHNIILGFRPSYVFVSLLNKPLCGNTSYIGITTNNIEYYNAISINDNGFAVSNINQHFLNFASHEYVYLAFTFWQKDLLRFMLLLTNQFV